MVDTVGLWELIAWGDHGAGFADKLSVTFPDTQRTEYLIMDRLIPQEKNPVSLTGL